MHPHLPILLLISQAVGLVFASKSVSKDLIRTFSNGRIVGGHPVTIVEYPYQLSLQYYGWHFCGASLIGTKWVLTAAHCTFQFNVTNLSIRAGTSYREYDGEVIEVHVIYNHPSYNPKTLDSDISVVKLVSPITSNKARTIPLASWYHFLYPWLSGTVTGWGVTKENGYSPLQLRAVTVPIINYFPCKMAYGTMITGNMFCAGTNNKDSCQGDSGGPLVISGKLYGIVSFGNGCGSPNYPGVYTRVSAFRSFINEITGI